MIAPRAARRAVGAVAIALLAGCASVPNNAAAPAGAASGNVAATNPVDPWENWNRKVYAFNDAIDKAVVKPVAETYQKVVPAKVRTGITNVLGNIRDVWSAANQLLQGKLQYGMEMGMRVATNTFFGLGGLLDPATEMGLVKRPEDFGQTLGVWGLSPGPYMVLPLLGPSSVRDTGGLVLDRATAPSVLPPTANGKVAVTGVELVDTRARLLSAGNLLDQVALDRYSFLRDAYLASRRDAVYDGAPPMETFQDDGADAPAVKPGTPPATAGAASAAAAAVSGAVAASAPTRSGAAAMPASSASAASAAGK